MAGKGPPRLPDRIEGNVPTKSPRVPPKKRQTRQPSLKSGVLNEFHCETIVYNFHLPKELFNTRKFSRETGIKTGERWSSILHPKERVGYHVHFNGHMEKEFINLTVAYWDGAIKTGHRDIEPFADPIMQWIGSFVHDSKCRVNVNARFMKPFETWKARFNRKWLFLTKLLRCSWNPSHEAKT